MIDTDFRYLRGQDAQGKRRTWRVRVGAEVEAGSVLGTAEATPPDGSGPYVLRTLPPVEVVRPDVSQTWLDNEIRAVRRLSTRYRADRAPAELPRVVGFEFDSGEPFALLASYPAANTGNGVSRLLDAQRTTFTTSLLRALAHLAAVDLVHGGVRLSSVRLTGATVRLVNFEHAVLTGEESPSGAGPAHPGDDVAAAGRLLHEVYTGTPVADDELPDHAEVPWLRTLLAGVFTEEPRDRPTALDLLRRLNSAAPAPFDDPDAALRRGRSRFDAVRAAKHQVLRPPPVPPVPAFQPGAVR